MPADTFERGLEFTGRIRSVPVQQSAGGASGVADVQMRFNESTLYIEVSTDGGVTWIPQIACYAFYA